MMTHHRPAARRLLLILFIGLLAAALRDIAVGRLPVDFDEPVYFRAGQRLAGAVRAGDLGRLSDADSAPEHPALVKLLYAAAFLRYPPMPELPADPTEIAQPEYVPFYDQLGTLFTAARRTSALFGVLHVLLVAAVSPIAAILLAAHTYTIKYTAQIYLEALPMFTATVCVLAYARAIGQGRILDTGNWKLETDRLRQSPVSNLQSPVLPPAFWWTLSAVALGLTAAGKYVYCIAGLAVVADYLWRYAAQRQTSPSPLLPFSPAPLLPLLPWATLALLTFLAANPNLWPDPTGRLWASIRFHAAYSQGEHVAGSGFPWWQPFVWLFTAQPVGWHTGAIFTALDGVTAALGVLGLRAMWQAWGGRGRVIVLWWAMGLAFLLLWSTKWPQYSLIMTAPMCLCAAEALRGLWRRLPEEMWARG